MNIFFRKIEEFGLQWTFIVNFFKLIFAFFVTSMLSSVSH